VPVKKERRIKGMRNVAVNLGARSYDIKIEGGLLRRIPALVRSALGERAGQAVVVTNPTVEPIYGTALVRGLRAEGFRSHKFLIGDGERFKTLKTASLLYSFLIEHRVERSDVIIALGGGVVGDLAGFAAATYLRGIRLVQVPTTLLSQIDSSVGGKTAVNHRAGKNLIGVFHQPSLVLIDPEVLSTLPMRQIQAGLQEAVKYGVIRDAELFARISERIDQIKGLVDEETSHLIERCCQIKAQVVEEDEREGGLRRILNFGHTVGHALEAATNYRHFLHGEAVGLGMKAAARISEQIGLLSKHDLSRIDRTIGSVGTLPSANSIALGDIISAMKHDKKAEGGRLSFVLPVEIGSVIIRSDVPPRIITTALKGALG
jgi:3-dehydroquinate synthase